MAKKTAKKSSGGMRVLLTVGSFTTGNVTARGDVHPHHQQNSLMKLIKIILNALLIALPLTASAQLGTWSTNNIANVPQSYADGAAAVLNGKIYAMGGGTYSCGTYTNLQVYNLTNNTWTTLLGMRTRRYEFGAAELNGLIYAVGGNPGCGNAAGLTVVEAYDPVSNTWSNRASLPTGGYGAAVARANGKIYFIGGSLNPTTVYAYNPTNDSWATKAPFLTNNAFCGVAVVNSIIYLIGGSLVGASANVYAYNPVTDSWTAKASMPTPRYDPAVGVIDGIIYVAGGVNTSGQRPRAVEAYNPQTDSWSTNTPLPFPILGASGAVVNGKLYVIGGYDTNNNTLATVEVFTPPPAGPVLNIAAVGSQSVLYWPASATNFILESTTNLSSPNWLTASDAVPVIAVIVSNQVPARYFRLKAQ